MQPNVQDEEQDTPTDEIELNLARNKEMTERAKQSVTESVEFEHPFTPLQSRSPSPDMISNQNVCKEPKEGKENKLK